MSSPSYVVGCFVSINFTISSCKSLRKDCFLVSVLFVVFINFSLFLIILSDVVIVSAKSVFLNAFNLPAVYYQLVVKMQLK